MLRLRKVVDANDFDVIAFKSKSSYFSTNSSKPIDTDFCLLHGDKYTPLPFAFQPAFAVKKSDLFHRESAIVKQKDVCFASMNEVQGLLEEIGRLMELKGENPFKIRAFEKAATAVAGQADLVSRAQAGTLTEIPGIGKAISEIITDFVLKGEVPVLDELRRSLPPGLLELTAIPGLGPKKARQLIDELGIHSLAELEYACRENRLLELKGFGAKIQKKLLDGVSFQKSTQGYQRLGDALPIAQRFFEFLKKEGFLNGKKPIRICETGALRRRAEILSELDFIVEEVEGSSLAELQAALEKAAASFHKTEMGGGHFKTRFFYAPTNVFGFEWAKTTGSLEHWKAVGAPNRMDVSTEEGFYSKLGLPWIPPEMRETGEEVRLARQGLLEQVLPWNGVQGIFHTHTVFSDGAATVKEMVLEAKRQGYQYIGISDHSQSAFYAHGLKPEDLLKQEKEIRQLQDEHPEIRIFWGVESDILADGSLDYEVKWLKKFDFVIASIHSRFQMDREAMTSRILKAVSNPYTRFLGHLTGRLLLGRKGYDIDIEKIIAEAAQKDVAIEINAHPARLDIDWRWGPELRKYGTLVSINPDAHEQEGISDTVYGVGVARKALLPKSLVVNARSVKEIEKWLTRE